MGKRCRILAALAALALVSAMPATAVAGHGHRGCGHHGVPGGNSQIGQYEEPGTLPGSCGNQTVDRSHQPSGHPISSATTSELQSFGPAGVAAAQLAAATSPPGSGGGPGTGGSGSGGSNGSSGDNGSSGAANGARVPGQGAGAASQVGTALTGGDVGGSMGILLPLII